MSIQTNILKAALMASALTVAALPAIGTTFSGAEAAGFSKERKGKRVKARSSRKQRFNTVRRKKTRNAKRRRIVRKRTRTLNQRGRIARPMNKATRLPKNAVVTKRRPIARPDITMPKTIVKRRPIARPAVTMPKAIIKRQPIARPAVTMPKTVVTGRPLQRPLARPAVTMPKSVINGRPRPARPVNGNARPEVTTPQAVVTSRAGNDPTAGRINNREQAAKQKQYQKCATFSLRVFQGGLSQANNDSAKIRAARSHYQANLSRCRALL